MSRQLSCCRAFVGLFVLAMPASAADFLGKSANQWGGQLSSPSAETRRSAAFALGKIGVDSRSEFDKLIRLIASEKDAAVKEVATAAVGDIAIAMGDAAKLYWATSSQALMSALADPSPRVRRSAAYAIGAFGAEAAPALPALREALRDGSAPIVRQNAAWALGRIGKDSKDGKPVGKDVVDLLCDRLRDDDPLVRRDAASALGEVGLPTAASAYKPLLDLVTSESAKGDSADDVLLRTALANLTVVLDNRNSQIADNINMLMNPNNPEQILTAGKDVLANLGGLGLPDAAARREELMARYKAALKEGNGQKVIEVFNDMARAGKEENDRLRPALAPINKLLSHEDADTARLAAFALARIGGPLSAPAVPVLQRSLFDPERSVQEQAATFLGEMGPDAAAAVDDLAACVQVGKPETLRAKAAVALMSIGTPSSRAIPQLINALTAKETDESRRENVRKYLAEVFLKMRYPNNKDAMPTLLELIEKDENRNVRHRCIWAFMNLRKEDFVALKSNSGKSATEAILSTLADPRLEPVVKYDAARCLADVLEADVPDPAIDWLVKMLGDESLMIYQRTGGDVGPLGREGTTGTSKVTEQVGGDPRYLAVNSLRKIGDRAKRPEVLAALRKATTNQKSQQLAEAATKLLKDWGQ
jgi:HEAT repeat protein